MAKEPTAPTELYRKYRPNRLEDVVGQAAAVKTLKSFKDVPHVLLFTGPPGTGKTTLARIMAGRVGCPTEINGRPNTMDYCEVNCGVVESAIDMVRDIDNKMPGGAMCGKSRVWVLDEVQSLSRAKFAQEAMLKVLEETPPHVYFMLCTTDPKKIIAAIRSRCTEVAVKPIPPKELRDMLAAVAVAEGTKASAELLDKIIAGANGSARNALVELGRVIGIADDEERLEAAGPQAAERAAFDLVKVLLPFSGKPNWKSVALVLKDIEDEDHEGLRLMLLASARTGLLRSGNSNLAEAIYALREPYYDVGAAKARLAQACYEICTNWK